MRGAGCGVIRRGVIGGFGGSGGRAAGWLSSRVAGCLGVSGPLVTEGAPGGDVGVGCRVARTARSGVGLRRGCGACGRGARGRRRGACGREGGACGGRAGGMKRYPRVIRRMSDHMS